MTRKPIKPSKAARKQSLLSQQFSQLPCEPMQGQERTLQARRAWEPQVAGTMSAKNLNRVQNRPHKFAQEVFCKIQSKE